MKRLVIAAVCAAVLAAPAAFAQDKTAKAGASTTTVKGENVKGKSGKHQVMAKKTEVKKTAKKNR